MTIFDRPRYQKERFEALVSEELPGVRFDIEHTESFQTIIRLRRLIEEEAFAVDDTMVLGGNGLDVLAHVTDEAIRRIRQKAMVAYGLDKAFEQAKAEAARQARLSQRQAWLAWIDSQRSTEEVEGPDGEMIEIKRPLSYEMGRLKEMLERSS